ncbi:MAG: hypothetical protein L0G96_16820 [Acinetobacter sp.]|nr:hypothetical protein [Acinetobacter sp.]
MRPHARAPAIIKIIANENLQQRKWRKRMNFLTGTTISIEKFIRNTTPTQRQKFVRIGKSYDISLPPVTPEVEKIAQILKDENDLKRLPVEYARKLIAIFNAVINLKHYKNKKAMIEKFLNFEIIYPKSYVGENKKDN